MYLISGSGPTADWYRNLLARPEVRVTIGHDQRAGHGRDVTDPAERRLVGDLMGAKYVGRRPRQRAHPPGVVLRRAAAAIEFDAP